MSLSCPGSPPDPPVGLVTRAYSNFCDVLCGEETIRCRLRGRLRLDGTGLLTGDRVQLQRLGEDDAVVSAVLPRRSQLRRPPVANVDLAVVVFTVKSPPLNLELVDRLLVLVRWEGLEAVLCLNKTDLCTDSELSVAREHYLGAGFELIETSAKLGTRVEDLTALIQGRVAVLAGQSGVGKSTLLNAIAPEADLAVGALSPKVQRGRHTTREVRLIPVEKGLIADTPGFVSLELPPIDPRRLAGIYQEMTPYLGSCRFADCLHDPEPGCAVKAAVDAGRISEGRYRGYVALLHELQARPKY